MTEMTQADCRKTMSGDEMATEWDVEDKEDGAETTDYGGRGRCKEEEIDGEEVGLEAERVADLAKKGKERNLRIPAGAARLQTNRCYLDPAVALSFK